MNLRRILLNVLAILLAVGTYAQGDIARVGNSETGVSGDIVTIFDVPQNEGGTINHKINGVALNIFERHFNISGKL